MIHLRQAVVVEGRYDKAKLASILDAVIIETGGFRIFKDKEKLAMLREIARRQGLVILTDSDTAGFKSFVVKLLHAESDILHVTVGNKDVAALGFKQGAGFKVEAAVAVALDCQNRDAKAGTDFLCVGVVVTAVHNHVNGRGAVRAGLWCRATAEEAVGKPA